MFALELKFKLMSCAMFFVCFGLLFSTQEFVDVVGMVCLKNIICQMKRLLTCATNV